MFYRLTNAGIVIDHRKDPVAAALHVIGRTDAAKHWRQSQIRPCLVAQVPVSKCVSVLRTAIRTYEQSFS